MTSVYDQVLALYEASNFESSRRFNPGQYSAGNLSRLLQALNNPQNTFKSIHIAGTVAKGATTRHLARFLQQQGLQVGMYTSPHLVDFHERIQINGLPVPSETLQPVFNNLKKYLDQFNISFFDCLTALAFMIFAEQAVEWAVIETGLGGRLDSTNNITPAFSVITPVGLDHQNILGETLAEIASEKAGIIKKQIPVYSYAQDPGVLEVLQAEADEKGSVLKVARPVGDETDYRVHNYAVSRWIFEDFFQQHRISEEEPPPGPASLEVLSKHPPVVFDSAHNEMAVQALCRWLSENHEEKKWHLFFNMMKERSLEQVLAPIEKLCKARGFTLSLVEMDDRVFHNSKSYARSVEIESLGDIMGKNEANLVFGSLRLYKKICEIVAKWGH